MKDRPPYYHIYLSLEDDPMLRDAAQTIDGGIFKAVRLSKSVRDRIWLCRQNEDPRGFAFLGKWYWVEECKACTMMAWCDYCENTGWRRADAF